MVGGRGADARRPSPPARRGFGCCSVDANNKLLWVNRGTSAAPTGGQAGPYMLFGYDANGNMTHRERRFNDSGFTSFDLYPDGQDNLRAIWNHGGSQIWAAAYNGDGIRVALQDTAGGSFPTQHDFTWGLGGLLYDTFQSAVYTPGVSQRVNGADTFFHTDWLGSTRYLSDSTGNNFPDALRYDAFGQRTDMNSPWGPTPFQFASDWGYQSEFATGPEGGTGLQYLEQRYYDPAIGRFTSPDPLSFTGGPNLYTYSDNDPVDEVDPGGLQSRGTPSLDLEDAPDEQLGGRGDITTRPFLRKASQLAGVGRNAIEFVGSFNEVTNAGLAANDIGAHHYGSAFLRLLGPLSKVFGSTFEELSGFLSLQSRPGRIRLPGGGGAVERVVSRIRESPRLVTEAEAAGRSLQTDLDNLTNRLAQGNLNPGIGNRSLGFGGIIEARARSGARVYFRVAGRTVEILAKSTKANQDEVISALRRLHGG